jgi:L-alanine-DL-glutamate epimerase-like enolase superfamily enzyme
MYLTDISAHALSSPIEPMQERAFHGGTRRLHKRDMVLITLETRDGLRGIAPGGASSSAMREFYEDASQEQFATAIETTVAPTLLDREIAEPEDGAEYVTECDLPEPLRTQAASVVDIALHDLFGKRNGVPVFELLSDDPGDTELDCYASAGMYMEPSGYARQAATLEAHGFQGYKYRPGIGPAGDRETIVRISAETSDDFAVMADAHTWWKLEDPYSSSQRDSILEAYEAANLYWLEEPVAPDDYQGYRDLDAATKLDLAGGESEHDRSGLETLVDTDSIAVLQGDVRHHGGYTGCLQAANYATDHGVRFVPHHFGTLLGLVANAHLVTAIDGDLLEYPVFTDDPHLDADPDPGMYPHPLAFEILDGDLTMTDGCLTVPDGPGLGVSIDDSVLERYPFREGAWTTFEYE